MATAAKTALWLNVLPPSGEESLSPKEADLMQSRVVNAIMQEEVGSSPRRFDGFVVNPGCLQVRCSDEATFNWCRPLLESMRYGGKPENERLNVSSPRDRPPVRAFKVWAPFGGLTEPRQVIDLLRRQNPTLRGDPLSLRTRGKLLDKLPNGSHLIIEVEEPLWSSLEELQYRPCLGVSRAVFTPYSMPKVQDKPCSAK